MSELRIARERQGLTQTELAKRAGILVSRYNMIEKGHRPATPEIAQRVAGILEVSVDAVFLPGSFTIRELTATERAEPSNG